MFRKALAGILLAAALGLSPGCKNTEPTYVDISQAKLELIATRLNTDVSTMLLTQKEHLMAALSQEFGMKVQEIYSVIDSQTESLGGAIDGVGSAVGDLDGTVGALRGAVAEIRPASEAAMEAVTANVITNPTEPANWLRGAVAAGGVLLAGLFGMRGRSNRKKKAGVCSGSNSLPNMPKVG